MGISPERQKEYRKKWPPAGMCRRCGVVPPEDAGLKNCNVCRVQIKEWKKANATKIRENHRDYSRRLRMAALAAYGDACACCGESEEVFLVIDHVDGGGSKHVKEMTLSFYNWLRVNGYPPGFQTLCHNCNWAKYRLGTCPHQDRKSS